jgi:hypothetical protein
MWVDVVLGVVAIGALVALGLAGYIVMGLASKELK